MSISEDKAVALAARNLAIAERSGAEVVAPCAACFLVLTKAQHMMAEYPALAAKVHKGLQAAGLAYEGRAVVRHPLDILVNDVGLDAIRAKVTQAARRLPRGAVLRMPGGPAVRQLRRSAAAADAGPADGRRRRRASWTTRSRPTAAAGR